MVFLLDNSDTLAAYEDKGKDNSVDSQEAGFQAMFNQLDRVQQVEMIQRKAKIYNIYQFLKSFHTLQTTKTSKQSYQIISRSLLTKERFA